MEFCKKLSFIWWLGMVAQFFLIFPCDCRNHLGKIWGRVVSKEQLQSPTVQLFVNKEQVTMTNGIVNVTLSIPDGLVTKISYNGIENLLDPGNDGGYWDMNFNRIGAATNTIKLSGTSYNIIACNDNQAEISFVRAWNPSNNSKQAPLNVDKRFVMLRGSPGLYTYAIFKRLNGYPAINIAEARAVFRLKKSMFHYMAISDERQRVMPTTEDRRRGKVLAYPEAVLLTNPSNPDFQGEVDDKYFYSCENKDNKVHGWISNTDPSIGFWMITPSNEFRTGGPFKQDLTSHVGPTVLSMFVSRHYAGDDLDVKFQDGEPWEKVFGPVFVYLNSNVSTKNSSSILWNDAKTRMLKEVASWPYTFPLSEDFIQPNQRGGVSGQLLVQDWYINEQPMPAVNAYIGLAAPGHTGSWQRESKGYQFWTQADSNGNFVIKGVIAGSYNLYAWVPGTIGDFKYDSIINISSGSEVKLTNLVYQPPRDGATLWEIGVPDRTANEFYVPDPSPLYKIYPYPTPVGKFRQYGLWSRYAELYPQDDLVYTVGSNNYTKDWFFAHVTRKVGDNTYKATTWRILFDLKDVDISSNYTLQISLASATEAELQVQFNDPVAEPSLFTTRLIGSDNTVARHGIHGLYWLYTISVSGNQLISGRNTIFLTQSRSSSPFREIMYDYIRFKGPVITGH